MEQLPLAISVQSEPSFDNFTVGENREAVTRVHALASAGEGERILYVWGPPGSGCTHLLKAAVSAAGGCYYGPGQAAVTGIDTLVAADHVECLDDAGQIALFRQINRAREGGARVLASGRSAPTGLAVRDDLRSRLGWGLVYQLRPLTDDDKKKHVRAEAARLGLRIPEEVLLYLFNRLPRDMRSLNAVLRYLDMHSMARQRALTLPMVRDAIERFDQQQGK